jgi:hypothetical protein
MINVVFTLLISSNLVFALIYFKNLAFTNLIGLVLLIKSSPIKHRQKKTAHLVKWLLFYLLTEVTRYESCPLVKYYSYHLVNTLGHFERFVIGNLPNEFTCTLVVHPQYVLTCCFISAKDHGLVT